MVLCFAALFGDAPEPDVDELAVQRWVRAARTGQPLAARRLYNQFVRRLYRTVRPWCPSDADAEDLVQETFARALRSLAEYEYRPGTRFIAWLATIALNLSRKQARRVHGDAPLSEAAQVAVEPAVDPDAGRRRAALLEALGKLEERERRILTLRYGAELNATEIARAVGLSSANVRKICERLRARLLQELASVLEEAS